MKKSTWIKLGIFAAVVLGFGIFFFVIVIRNNIKANSDLSNCACYNVVQGNRATISSGRIHVPSVPSNGDKYRKETYVVEKDQLTISYEKDAKTKIYLPVLEESDDIDLSEKESYISVSYLSDQNTALAQQVSDFYNEINEEGNLTFDVSENTTWEDISRYYYQESNEGASVENCIFNSYDWDINVWRFVLLDDTNDKTLEVLFFERADGFYRIDLCYPKKEEKAQENIYSEFLTISFNTDKENLERIQSGLVVTEQSQSDGSLIVTVVNNSGSAIEVLYCDILLQTGDNTQDSGMLFTQRQFEVAPGSINTFTYDAEVFANSDSYTLEVTASPHCRFLDKDGTITSGDRESTLK